MSVTDEQDKSIINGDVRIAREVIATECEALNSLAENLDKSFSDAVNLITECNGYVIVTGVGKSGHIGRKIAATFASTGNASFFVHPTEASHGDLGMINDGSVVLAISNSGETREMRDILLYSLRQNVPIIAITSRPKSFLDQKASTTLLLPSTPEACPNGLAPTTSTTMTLALGDALAVAAMKRTNFSREEFGTRHPGGSLGLGLQSVSEWIELQKSPPNPCIALDTPFVEILNAISKGRCGAVSVVDATGRLKGVITDGDIRRTVSENHSVHSLTAADIFCPDPVTVSNLMRMSSVVGVLQSKRISQVVVVCENAKPIAIIHIKDLMQAGYL